MIMQHGFIRQHKVVINQTHPPSCLIVTIDGEVSDLHEKQLVKISSENQGINVQLIRSEPLNSRGALLNLAVKGCKTKYVAIMDADDISHPNRFEEQLFVFMKNDQIDVVGAWIEEIDPLDTEFKTVRKVPMGHTDILRFAKYRNPINQMTVMFKKTAVIDSGNYESIRYFEDFWLWIRMLNSGKIFYNIQKPLVTARASKEMVKRRSGLLYAKQEFVLYKKAYRIGFLTLLETLTCLLLRLPLRLLPQRLLFRFFNQILRAKPSA